MKRKLPYRYISTEYSRRKDLVIRGFRVFDYEMVFVVKPKKYKPSEAEILESMRRKKRFKSKNKKFIYTPPKLFEYDYFKNNCYQNLTQAEYLNQFSQDIVYARFIAYMSRALRHVRQDYLDDQDHVHQFSQNISDTELEEMLGNAYVEPLIISKEIKRDQAKKLIFAITTGLTEKQRKIVNCYYTNDMKISEIASEYGISERAVCKLKSKALYKLKEELIKYKEDLL